MLIVACLLEGIKEPNELTLEKVSKYGFSRSFVAEQRGLLP